MNKRKMFKSTGSNFTKYDGPVTVVRKLTRKEADAEVGPMFKCRAPNGELFDAFGDELSNIRTVLSFPGDPDLELR